MAKNKIQKIKSGFFDRSLSLTKVAVRSGASLAANHIKNFWSEEQIKDQSLRKVLETQAHWLADELGRLKGSLMKVGQMLALYGEHFFPEEIVKVLKTLNEDSPPLDWPAIEPIIRRRLKEDLRAQLEIETEALAAASLGQVHRATIKASGEHICLKIQYPGVSQAIDNDVRTLRSMLSMLRLIPSHKSGFDDVLKEVKSMLRQEVDYGRELTATDQMRELLAARPGLIVPRTYPQFSGPKILATSYEPGFGIDCSEVQSLSSERRSRLGRIFANLFLEELFTLHIVQTDPHFGNYKIRIGERADGEDDSIILLDFGAVRKFSKVFVEHYRKMLVGALLGDDDMTIQAAIGIGFLSEDDSNELYNCFLRIAYAAIEPWLGPDDPRLKKELFDAEHHYLWGQSDLPKRVTSLAKEYAFTFRLRPPPREVLFLDRKIGGVFIALHKLNARFNGWELVKKHLLTDLA
ncbi:MAG: ABC1 kinase family protein [Oligoflexus sp.]